MAEAEAKERESSEETTGNGSNGGGGAGRTAVRAAAIAAVSGATALAAKKAFGDRGSSESRGDKSERGQRSRRNDDVFGSMMTSAWDSARDSVVPMIEDAATSAGEYLARSGPDLLRETIVPRFIDGFERGRGSKDD
jgi:hypothetical protein